MSGGATPLLQPENDTARASTSATERIRAGFSEPPLCPPTHGGGSAEGGTGSRLVRRRGASGSTRVRRSGRPALTVRQSARGSYGGCVVSPGVVRPGSDKGPEVTKGSAVL